MAVTVSSVVGAKRGASVILRLDSVVTVVSATNHHSARKVCTTGHRGTGKGRL